MSNLTISGIYGTYTYTTANLYSYIGSVPQTSQELKEAFNDYGVTPTGGTSDLQKLEKAIYQEYYQQVQEQIANQNAEEALPWANVCNQIGVPVTGDKEVDRTAFEEAINLLSQSAIDGPSQTYFAGLKTEAQSVFDQATKSHEQTVLSYSDYIRNYDW